MKAPCGFPRSCYECPDNAGCGLFWSKEIDKVHKAIQIHEHNKSVGKFCEPDCIVCKLCRRNGKPDNQEFCSCKNASGYEVGTDSRCYCTDCGRQI